MQLLLLGKLSSKQQNIIPNAEEIKLMTSQMMDSSRSKKHYGRVTEYYCFGLALMAPRQKSNRSYIS